MNHPRLRLARPLLLAAAVAGASAARAQDVLWEDTFDAGVAGWDATGQWGWIADGGPCTSAIEPLPSPGGAARFGLPDCTFDGVPFAGTLTTADPIAVPSNATDVTLSFWQYSDSEGCNIHWDFHHVFLSNDGGATWSWVGTGCSLLNWNQVVFDLDPYRGQEVLLRFDFDAVDQTANDGLGWIVDDVRVTGTLCPIEAYCVAAPNSVSATGATLGYAGSSSVSAGDLVLVLDDAPPAQFALFFYGSEQAWFPVAEGFVCVGGGSTSLVRLLPATATDAQGRMERAFDATASQGSPNPVLPGSTWNFQGWYRDPAGGPGGSNLTQGLSVTFCP